MKLLPEMLSHADPSQVAGLSRFFKTGPGQYGEGDRFLGIKVPVTRAVVKECWKETSFEELETCIASEFHEVRLASLLALVEIFAHAKKAPALQQQCIDFYLPAGELPARPRAPALLPRRAPSVHRGRLPALPGLKCGLSKEEVRAMKQWGGPRGAVPVPLSPSRPHPPTVVLRGAHAHPHPRGVFSFFFS